MLDQRIKRKVIAKKKTLLNLILKAYCRNNFNFKKIRLVVSKFKIYVF